MSPAAMRGELLGRVLRVVDEDVGASGEVAQGGIEVRFTRLVVGGIDDRASGRLEAEAEATLRMIEPARHDARIANREGIAAGDFAELALRRHGAQIHREVRVSHLRLEDALQAVAAEEIGPEAIEVKGVLRGVKRSKKRDALNMIPMIVGDEDMRADGVLTRRGGPAVAEHAEAGAAIEDEAGAVRSNQFKAGSVAAVTKGDTVHRRRGPANAPESQLGNALRHDCLEKGALCPHGSRSPSGRNFLASGGSFGIVAAAPTKANAFWPRCCHLRAMEAEKSFAAAGGSGAGVK